MFSYYLTNNDTNEIVISKWPAIPCSKQLDSVRNAFNWHYDDHITVSGFRSNFHLIGNTKLIRDGNHFYPSFIKDHTYSITFNKDTIIQIELLDNIDDMLKIISM